MCHWDDRRNQHQHEHNWQQYNTSAIFNTFVHIFTPLYTDMSITQIRSNDFKSHTLHALFTQAHHCDGEKQTSNDKLLPKKILSSTNCIKYKSVRPNAISPRHYQYVRLDWPSSAPATQSRQHCCAAWPVRPVPDKYALATDKQTNEQTNRRTSPLHKALLCNWGLISFFKILKLII